MRRTIRLSESNLHRIIKESVKKVLREGAYNSRTYKREREREFSKEEVGQLVSMLSKNPIEQMWKPQNLGFCQIQRVESGDMPTGRHSLLSREPQVTYCEGNNGEIFIQIGKEPNTPWFEEGGYTYMCWK